jgi:hypothetical protein
MATIIRYVQNDYGNPITFTLQNSDGSAFNLSGYAVTFRAQFGNTSGTKVSGTMSVTNDPGGVCTYTPQSTDFNEAGSYNVQITATMSFHVMAFEPLVAEPALPSF